MKGSEEFRPTSRKAWRAWLAKYHAASSGVWVVFAKRHTGLPTLSWDDAVEEALCFGWIDSVRHPVDDRFFKQRFTPRKPKSVWSNLNKERVQRLVAAGLMTSAGMALIELAKRSGTWDALAHVAAMRPPAELRAALDANPRARANWDAFPVGIRKQFLYYLFNAKRPETRARRIREIVDRTAKNTPIMQASASRGPAPSRGRRPR